MAIYLPTKVTETNWIYCNVDDYAHTYPDRDGKWMMFFHMSQLDAKWNEACQLYRAGKLTGIRGMKVSTAKQNPMPNRLHAHDEGIIIFYCGPSEDEQNVMSYGRNLLNHMHYARSHLYYKSDKPHLINHSHKYKHMYAICTKEHYAEVQMMADKRQRKGVQNYAALYNNTRVNYII